MQPEKKLKETIVPIDVESVRSALGCEIDSEVLAKELDKKDTLAHFRERFHIPKTNFSDFQAEPSREDAVYLCGNSLGLQPKETQKLLEEELIEWQRRAVEGHFHHSKSRPWLTTDEALLDYMADIVGAQKEEVAVMNSLTVNLHLMMVSFYRPIKGRSKILIESRSFPSDLYAVASQISFHGFDPKEDLIQLEPRKGEHYLRTEDILKLIEEQGDTIALIMFSGVQYYVGQFFDIEAITKAGHSKGCKVGWDLAHAVGNVELKLHDWDVDFACWCSYKYLNSGPGTIGGCFVHAKHATEKDLPRLAGWWGHDLKTRFNMDELEFNPIAGAHGWRLSNPPVLCVAAILASLKIFGEATMPRLRAKSVALTGYMEKLINAKIPQEKVKIITPTDPARRGCQLSLLFSEDVVKVSNKLLEKGIICDVRKPNVLRVSPTPLYNTFADVRKFVTTLQEVLH